MDGIHETALGKGGHDGFQIFLGDPLRFRDLFQRDVLIAAPLRQHPKIFREYQDSLDRLIIPDGVEVDRYFVVNDCPEVIPEIRGAAYDEVNSVNVTVYQDHLWTGELVSAMSVYRNMTIRRALEGGYDYLLSVDTDLVLEPHTLEYLLKADKDRLVEVLQNMMENAIKYGDGKEIHITLREEEDCKLLSVENTGCSLKEEELPNLFDSFYRGSNSQGVKGSGLGLYICRELMKKMDGEVFAEIKNGSFLVTAVIQKA